MQKNADRRPFPGITGPQGRFMIMLQKRGGRRHPLGANRILALGFIVLILTGTVLLSLPFASRNGRSAGMIPAMFTAASATCVTGLSVFDTWTQWSPFGQTVILCLIEIGGLGFMAVASLLVFILRGRLGMRDAMVISQTMGEEDMSRIRHMQGFMLIACILTELFGAAVLTLRFLPLYGFAKASRLGLFHSVSAFCNAGFDIFGFIVPGGSLTSFYNDPLVLLTLSFLIVTGGIGFLVWEEVYRVRRFSKLSVYTRLVLITTLALLLGGTLFFAAAEWNNPATLGPMTAGEKVLAAFFQSVTLRTAGFSGIDQTGLTEAGKAFSVFLMLIGGSSGSTAGGLKTVTFLVILLFLWSRMRGKSSIVIYRRTIPAQAVFNALTIFGIMIALCFLGTVFITCDSGLTLTEATFESVSAIATVGLSLNVTPRLHTASRILIILFMYFGRVGVLTISLGFLKEKTEPRFRYADTTILIG